LPWTVAVAAPAGFRTRGPERFTLLVWVFIVLAGVWLAGAYFLFRSIRRENAVARLQSDFVAAVSHEFRSPLSSLCQISELLHTGRIPAEPARRESFQILFRETQRLRTLVERLLDFGRLQNGSAVYRFRNIRLGSFVENLIAEFTRTVSSDGFRIELRNFGDERYVRADPEALSLCLWNLLDNAVKYSPESKVVWINTGTEGDRVLISVEDHGMGIPSSEQSRIFEKFVRGHDAKARRIGGTGVGLAMVREIMAAHNGDIRLVSEPGRGSRFTIVLQSQTE
jgi:signal transduction histidine kinase